MMSPRQRGGGRPPFAIPTGTMRPRQPETTSPHSRAMRAARTNAPECRARRRAERVAKKTIRGRRPCRAVSRRRRRSGSRRPGSFCRPSPTARRSRPSPTFSSRRPPPRISSNTTPETLAAICRDAFAFFRRRAEPMAVRIAELAGADAVRPFAHGDRALHRPTGPSSSIPCSASCRPPATPCGSSCIRSSRSSGTRRARSNALRRRIGRRRRRDARELHPRACAADRRRGGARCAGREPDVAALGGAAGDRRLAGDAGAAARRDHRLPQRPSAAARGGRRGDGRLPAMAGGGQLRLPRHARIFLRGTRERCRDRAPARPDSGCFAIRPSCAAARPGACDRHAGDPRLPDGARSAHRHQGQREVARPPARLHGLRSASSSSRRARSPASSGSSASSPRPPSAIRSRRSR